MNANQIINMVIRMVMRKLMRKGVDAGINAVGKRMSKGEEPPQDHGPKTGDTSKRMRQTMKMGRRIGRF